MALINKVQLITYVDRFSGGDLKELQQILDSLFTDLFGGVHLLPFYENIDGEDAGYDPIDHTNVDQRLGNWSDVYSISERYDVLVDLIVNHISADSPQFLDYLSRGADSEYSGMFLRYHDVFPQGATEEEILNIYRPRPDSPFTAVNIGAEKKELVWTTFSSKQVDIDVFHPQGKAYIERLVDIFAENGVTTIRLDAIGYAVKKAGSCCFMIPETYKYIDELTARAKSAGINVLVEIHSHYQQQIQIAQKVDWVYDFALPPLVLFSLYTKTCSALKTWLNISPRNCFTVLDTHDGIGIVDVASEGQLSGLLDTNEVNFLVDEIHKRCENQSRKSTGETANNLDIYQVNCTFYSALGKNDQDYLLSRLIQFICPGIPQVYYVGLLAGENDMALLEQTGVGRDINRHYYKPDELKHDMSREVVQNLFSLIRFRNNHPAFCGEFILSESTEDTLEVLWSGTDVQLQIEVYLRTSSFLIRSVIKSDVQLMKNWSDLENFVALYAKKTGSGEQQIA